MIGIALLIYGVVAIAAAMTLLTLPMILEDFDISELLVLTALWPVGVVIYFIKGVILLWKRI